MWITNYLYPISQLRNNTYSGKNSGTCEIILPGILLLEPRKEQPTSRTGHGNFPQITERKSEITINTTKKGKAPGLEFLKDAGTTFHQKLTNLFTITITTHNHYLALQEVGISSS